MVTPSPDVPRAPTVAPGAVCVKIEDSPEVPKVRPETVTTVASAGKAFVGKAFVEHRSLVATPHSELHGY